MLDSDLAKLYQCANGTKTINQAVKRHLDRFPNDFYFQLTKEEFDILKSQVGTSSSTYGGVRKLPCAFTEQGVAMLATVLRTPIASEISVKIMRAFVSMRKYLASSLLEQKYINDLVLKHDRKINLLENVIKTQEEKKNHIFMDGQIYDAYSKIVEIFKLAKNDLIIIDAYADKNVLDMIRTLDIKIILITREKKLLKQLDIDKYNEQYDNLKIVYNDTFHDRYFIIDKKEIYHSGTRINYAGKRVFSLHKLEDKEIKNTLMNKIKNLI